MPNSNVLRFPTDSPSGQGLKLFAIIFYLFLAFMLASPLSVFGLALPFGSAGDFLSEGGLFLLVMLGVLYNVFVRKRMTRSPYFKKNALLLGILLVLALLVYKLTVVLILLLAGIYWLLVGRSGRDAPYFLKFHILTGLILNFFLLMGFLILNGTVALLASVLKLVQLGPLVEPGFLLYGQTVPFVMLALFWGVAAWLSISAVMGRTPYIGVVTDNVRYWS